MVQQWLLRIRNKTYFVPTVYSILAMILSTVVILIDTQYSAIGQHYLPSFFFTSVELAKTILSTLAGSLLTMTTISFSTIMVVLTLYSAQFSPRTLQDFLTNKFTLRVLGIFMGGFIYTILTLLFMKERPEPDLHLVLSAGIGVLVAILCLAYFVLFIHHVATSIQVNFLIDRLTAELLKLVDDLTIQYAKDEQIRPQAPEDLKALTSDTHLTVYSNKIGYIQYINAKGLVQFAKTNEVIIKAEKMIGDYVSKATTLFSMWGSGEHLSEEKANMIATYVVIGKERDKRYDIEFGLSKLTEVALRALSPGINDPNTASFCIRQLGMILDKISKAEIEKTYYFDAQDQLRLIFEDMTFEELLYKTFFQLRYYSVHEVSVAASLLEALTIIAERNSDEVKKVIWNFTRYIMGGFDKSVLEDLDRHYINKKLRDAAMATGNELDDQDWQEQENILHSQGEER